jgi:predicted RNase H-like HicB family nuclease
MSDIKLTAVFEPCNEGGFIAYIDEIPGINSQGETVEEAKENLADAINLVFEERRANKKIEKAYKVKDMVTQTLTFSL